MKLLIAAGLIAATLGGATAATAQPRHGYHRRHHPVCHMEHRHHHRVRVCR